MYEVKWTKEAEDTYINLRQAAKDRRDARTRKRIKKSSQDEGLFKQVAKTVSLLRSDPRHPGLHAHEYSSIENPYDKSKKVFEAYAQNKSPGAYRVFWCYGPGQREITIIAITPHP